MDKTITISLTLSDLNTVLEAVGELPYRVANPIIQEIYKQAVPQTRETPEVEPSPPSD